jgi:hypothetical protein
MSKYLFSFFFLKNHKEISQFSNNYTIVYISKTNSYQSIFCKKKIKKKQVKFFKNLNFILGAFIYKFFRSI